MLTYINCLDFASQLATNFLKDQVDSAYEVEVEGKDEYRKIKVLDGNRNEALMFSFVPVTKKEIMISVVDKNRSTPRSTIIDWTRYTDSDFNVQHNQDDIEYDFKLKIQSLLGPAGEALKYSPEQHNDTGKQKEDSTQQLGNESSNPYGLPFDIAGTSSISQPDLPKFDDEYEILERKDRSYGSKFPSIGEGDLYPPGIPRHPSLKPHIDPLAGSEGNGMYPSSHHPIFGPPKKGFFSSDKVPPGARYDDPSSDPFGSGPGNFMGPGPGSNSGFNPPFM